jgi:hypothetical protein
LKIENRFVIYYKTPPPSPSFTNRRQKYKRSFQPKTKNMAETKKKAVVRKKKVGTARKKTTAKRKTTASK